ncbi:MULTISPECIES: contact-dependent growth inhibition system immunity protein [unclassified Streptomyces]|uniref:contact-dependent growth inhibition system immunity protein n=1 Tax=unclassified Streptomyces TaxID=2593676 RepID=UPI000CD5767F|nr:MULTISPECIES: contact-dependent growth inhibition system immunity protein [unclassified Streptomyces]MCI4041752.1 contact-dependent growth inhibition system immunity protein [Streptomyces sp. TRM75563]
MPMKPFEFDRRYGELDQVVSAHIGQNAENVNEDGREPSHAMQAYLRHTWHTRPWALAIAEQQLREYARFPPGRLRLRLGEFYPVPDVGLPESRTQDWLLHLADQVRRSVDSGEVPVPSAPRTHWEWHARFPELAQFLGGWFSQDMVDEFADHEAAVSHYEATTDRALVARLVGEVAELLALDLEETDYVLGLAELGLEVDPPAPLSVGAWLEAVMGRLGRPRPKYGPSPTAE